MYCAYQGAANGEFWYVIYDGTSWTDGNKTAYATYGAPALAAYNGTLHVFHEGYQTASVGEGASIGGTIGGFGGSVGGAPGAAAGAAVGAVGGAIGTPIVNAINGPRSFKLWYTAAKLDIRILPLRRIPIPVSASPTRHRSQCQATNSTASTRATAQTAKSGGST